MNTVKLKNWFMTISLLILSSGMSACATGVSSTHWKEEVLLHDGSTLIVDRHFTFDRSPSKGITLEDQTITFTLPATKKKISWKTIYQDKTPERDSLGPLLLDVVGDVPYLATSPAGCIAYNKWGRPNPPYVLFRYENDTWQQIPLREFPSQLTQANLMGIPPSERLKPYYTLNESRAERNNGNVAAYAKTIWREAVKPGDSIVSCQEMVYYKGAWVGPGDSIGKRMMDIKSK